MHARAPQLGTRRQWCGLTGPRPVAQVNRSTADTFLNHVNKHQAPGQANKKFTAEPIFVVDGVTFCHIQTSKMFFVMTTVKNMQ